MPRLNLKLDPRKPRILTGFNIAQVAEACMNNGYSILYFTEKCIAIVPDEMMDNLEIYSCMECDNEKRQALN